MSDMLFAWTHSAEYDDTYDGWTSTWCSASLEVGAYVFSSEEAALSHFKRWYAQKERSRQIERSVHPASIWRDPSLFPQRSRYGGHDWSNGWSTIHAELVAMIENIGQRTNAAYGGGDRWDRLDIHRLLAV